MQPSDYQRTKAYLYTTTDLVLNYHGHFKSHIKALLKRFWEVFFSLNNDNIIKYELRGYELNWRRNSQLMKYLAANDIVTWTGEFLVLAAKGKQLIEEARNELREEVMLLEKMEKLEDKIQDQSDKIDLLLAMLTPEQKAKVPHLKIVK